MKKKAKVKSKAPSKPEHDDAMQIAKAYLSLAMEKIESFLTPQKAAKKEKKKA